jgi:ABC-type cobalamin transport system ATPase subunit
MWVLLGKMSMRACLLVSSISCQQVVGKQAILSDMGATISGDGTVQTFGNDVESLEAAESSVAVCFPSLLLFFFPVLLFLPNAMNECP